MKTHLIIAGLIGGIALSAPASEQVAKDEEALDARIGLKEKPFVVNLAALKTRSELSEKAQVRTGLPSYDQQVETAQAAPAALLEKLTAPDPAPQPVVRAPPPRREPDPEPQPPEPNPNCYIGQFGELVCP